MKEYAIVHYPAMGGPRVTAFVSAVSDKEALAQFRKYNGGPGAIVLLVAPMVSYRRATKKFGNIR